MPRLRYIYIPLALIGLLAAACSPGQSRVYPTLEEPLPYFAVFIDADIIDGFTWPKADGSQDWQVGESVDITLHIYDREGGDLLYSETRPSFLVQSKFPEYSLASEVHFEVGGSVDIVRPGVFVVMESPGVRKSLLVSELSVEVTNPDEDLIRGIAPAGETVEVSACISEQCTLVHTVSDAAGSWSASFVDAADLAPGTRGSASLLESGHPDEDGGDRTAIEWSIPSPFIMAWPEYDRVEGKGWPLGAELTLTVVDADGTSHSFEGVSITPPWDPAATFVAFDLPFDLDAGDQITLTDGLITKFHVVADLRVDANVDEAQNIVSGSASPGSQIDFGIHEVDGFEFSIQVDPDGTGLWQADFDSGPSVPHDLVPGTGIAISQSDEDYDVTHIERFLLQPHIGASLVFDWIEVRDFSRSQSVTVSIYDRPGGELLFGPQSFPTDDEGFVFIEHPQHGVDLLPGVFVTVLDESNGTMKELEIGEITVDEVDFEAGTASGSAPPGAEVQVDAGNQSAGFGLRVTAGDDGRWFADFSAQDFTLQEDMAVQARLLDEDGDASVGELAPDEEP